MNFIYTPYVLKCIHFKHNERFGSPARTVMDYEFDFSVGCDREMWLDNERYKIEKGSLVIRKPGQKVSSKGNFDCYMLTLQFSGQSLYSNYSRNTATQMQAPFESKIWDVLPSVFTPAHYNEYVGIFDDLLSVNEVDINENTKIIAYGVFKDCARLTSIEIPNNVTSIGDWAFYDCNYLTSVTIGDSVTSIGDWAFYSSDLASITIPYSVTSIGERAFSDCHSLTTVTIGDSVTSISDWAFYNCSYLTSVTIGDGVTSIGYGAFYYCTSLTSVTIPDSVTSIEDRAFYDCVGLSTINYKGTSSQWGAIYVGYYWSTGAGDYIVIYDYTEE